MSPGQAHSDIHFQLEHDDKSLAQAISPVRQSRSNIDTSTFETETSSIKTQQQNSPSGTTEGTKLTINTVFDLLYSF